MKRFGRIVLLVTVASGVLTGPAFADPPLTMDSSEFATKCSTGTIILGQDLLVTGGTGTLTADCFLELGDDVTLTFRNANLDGDGPGCCLLVVSDAGRGSAISVLRSAIDLGDTVQLSAGCCSGDGGLIEAFARVDVQNSLIRGATVEISASTADDFGDTSVRNSTLVATSAHPFALFIVASHSGIDGNLQVLRNSLVSAGGLLIGTGSAGTTRVIGNGNTIAGDAFVFTGSGGTCFSAANSPPLPCTGPPPDPD